MRPCHWLRSFPYGILDLLYSTRRHLYDYLEFPEAFNPVEVKKSIIKNNIFGVDIEQGAVDIARLRFWLAILLEETEPSPLPNLDYRIIRGNSLLTTFNDEYLDLSCPSDRKVKINRMKRELFILQNQLYSLMVIRNWNVRLLSNIRFLILSGIN